MTLPPIVIGGIFGMNNDDLPKDYPFLLLLAYMIIGAVCTSPFLLLHHID